MSLPDVPASDKVRQGNVRMTETRQVVNALQGTVDTRVQPVTLGGTGATTRAAAKTNLGFTYGTGNPPTSGVVDGDVYFKIV